MTKKELFLKAFIHFEEGKEYDIPDAIPQGYTSRGFSAPMRFKFLGSVGNGNLFQFQAKPGGWTVSLCPVQLTGVM